MFVLFVGPPVLTGPLWCGPENPRTALRSLGVAPKTGPQRSGPVWFAVLAVPFRGLQVGRQSVIPYPHCRGKSIQRVIELAD